MKRRHFLASPALLLPGWIRADTPKVQTLDQALLWLSGLENAVSARTTGTWPLGAVLDHLAQSIEMSLHGYPQPNSALFQHTAGAAAFAVFKWRGKMSHRLDEPIPGAPPLPMQGDWKIGAERLRRAINGFEAHTGPLKPHFAYGALSKADFAAAHSMHIANHQDEVVVQLKA
nr:DUF1569 domain-containing protein [uncultured Roseateles sp.]